MNQSFKIEDGCLLEYRGVPKRYTIRSAGKTIGTIDAWDKDCVVEVTVPGTIKTISYGAFRGCRNLHKIILSEGIEGIRWGSFDSCDKLTDLYIPTSLRSIHDDALPLGITLHAEYTSGLWHEIWKKRCTSLVRPVEGIFNVGAVSAIAACRSGKYKLRLYVGECNTYEFLNCLLDKCTLVLERDLVDARFILQGSTIRSIEIGKDVSYIHPQALDSNDMMCSDIELESIFVHPDNKHFCSRDGVLFCGNELRRFPPNKFAHIPVEKAVYNVPADTKAIGPRAFAGAYGLEEIVVGKDVSWSERALEGVLEMPRITRVELQSE